MVAAKGLAVDALCEVLAANGRRAFALAPPA
jgi:hypothetical protein